MPVLNTRPPQYRKQRDLNAEWNTFRKGLNLLLRPTELGNDEYSQGDNIMLIGSGVPTGRWGTSTYFTVNATGSIRGFATYNNTASLTNELLALSDAGFMVKQSGASYTMITGQSYPSGSIIRSEQLGGFTYLASKDRPLTRYNGLSLGVFATVSPPVNPQATNFSGVSGTAIWSWKILAVGPNGGQTTPSTPVTLPNLPQDLSKTTVHVRWSQPSAASITGFEIYRGFPGDETFLSAVGASTSLFVDTGEPASDTILAPVTNTTGGMKSELIGKDPVGDRLLFVDKDDPTKLVIGGRYPNHTKTSWADGGGYVYVGPDDGFKITGFAVQPGSNKITVFKEFGSYAVELDYVTIGNYTILDPKVQPISTTVGCSNADTIQTVENDIFHFGRKGIYVVGYEPNFLSIIRTNEISARMRPYLANLSEDDYAHACSLYVDNKYILSFPDRREMMVYDRERGSFAGIWKLPFGISHMKKYVDGSGTERWVLGSSESNQVYTFERNVTSDNGTIIAKTLRTNKEDFGTWSILKIIKLFYILFRNITGEVSVSILLEDRNGTTSAAKTFTISGAEVLGNSGWGATLWGDSLWGDTEGDPITGSDEIYRWSQLFKSARLMQVEISTTQGNSNFELLQIRSTADNQGEGSLSSSQRV